MNKTLYLVFSIIPICLLVSASSWVFGSDCNTDGTGQNGYAAVVGGDGSITIWETIDTTLTSAWNPQSSTYKTRNSVDMLGYTDYYGAKKLMMVYSAKDEGLGGAVVSRISDGGGMYWSGEQQITPNQHPFGMTAICIYGVPSIYVAFKNNNDNIKLIKYDTYSDNWNQEGKVFKNFANNIGSNYLAVQEFQGTIYVAAVTGSNKIRIIGYDTRTGNWDTNYTFADRKYKGGVSFVVVDDIPEELYLITTEKNTTNDIIMKYTTSGTYKESWDDYLMSYYGDPYGIPLTWFSCPRHCNRWCPNDYN